VSKGQENKPESGARNGAILGALAQGNVCLNGGAIIFSLPVTDREIQQFDQTAVCQGKLNLKLPLAYCLSFWISSLSQVCNMPVSLIDSDPHLYGLTPVHIAPRVMLSGVKLR